MVAQRRGRLIGAALDFPAQQLEVPVGEPRRLPAAVRARAEVAGLPVLAQHLFNEGLADAGWDVPPNMTLEEIEKLVIERALQRTGGDKRAAANLLGIYRPRLYSKIKKYKIDIPALTAS